MLNTLWEKFIEKNKLLILVNLNDFEKDILSAKIESAEIIESIYSKEVDETLYTTEFRMFLRDKILPCRFMQTLQDKNLGAFPEYEIIQEIGVELERINEYQYNLGKTLYSYLTEIFPEFRLSENGRSLSTMMDLLWEFSVVVQDKLLLSGELS